MRFGLCDKRVSSDVPALLCYPYTLPHDYIRNERTRGARPTTAIVSNRGVCHRYTKKGGGGLDGMGLITEVPPPRGTSAYA